ncbi:VOC family protein [Paenisporosarcina cavernae]|uniref:Glyoxalase n=1 Tax=Paenisporosarcina cavernae TaxID=2320858 RepID=A0A385YPT8_9BACL|nr:VOC family protein [Paenisporosarcina cavernae]AYC28524.1 glyoxalase [Paenisporosarcina cavernae]
MSVFLKRLDHIQLSAPIGSEMKAREFYNKILGLPEVEKPEELKKRGGCWCSNGSVHVHIGVEQSFVAAKKAHPAFEVDALDEWKEHLSMHSIAYVIDDALPGANRIYVNDPFGNRLEILEWL